MRKCFPIISNLQTHYHFSLISKKWINMQEAGGLSKAPNTAGTISCKAWNSPVEFPSRESKPGINESEDNMFNPIFKRNGKSFTDYLWIRIKHTSFYSSKTSRIIVIRRSYHQKYQKWHDRKKWILYEPLLIKTCHSKATKYILRERWHAGLLFDIKANFISV